MAGFPPNNELGGGWSKQSAFAALKCCRRANINGLTNQIIYRDQYQFVPNLPNTNQPSSSQQYLLHNQSRRGRGGELAVKILFILISDILCIVISELLMTITDNDNN